MKIKIFLLTKDKGYARRFVNMVTERYLDQLDIYVFSRNDSAREAIQRKYPDILLVDQDFAEEVSEPPRICELIYLVNQKGMESLDGHKAICKYQKISDIYRELLDILADRTESLPRVFGGGKEQRILTFFSAAGGTGTSTAAAACAWRMAERGEKVLYLNLEELGTADVFFQADGNYDFSRVLYALAMSNAGTSVKMESSVKQDAGGVYFYSGCRSALDMCVLDEEMMEGMFEELKKVRMFNRIVVDMGFSLTERTYRQIERSQASVFVSDGSETSNLKLRRCLEALEILAEQRNRLALNRIYVMYNRFSSTKGRMLEDMAFKNIGGVNRIENAGSRELVRIIAQRDVFDAIIS